MERSTPPAAAISDAATAYTAAPPLPLTLHHTPMFNQSATKRFSNPAKLVECGPAGKRVMLIRSIIGAHARVSHNDDAAVAAAAASVCAAAAAAAATTASDDAADATADAAAAIASIADTVAHDYKVGGRSSRVRNNYPSHASIHDGVQMGESPSITVSLFTTGCGREDRTGGRSGELADGREAGERGQGRVNQRTDRRARAVIRRANDRPDGRLDAVERAIERVCDWVLHRTDGRVAAAHHRIFFRLLQAVLSLSLSLSLFLSLSLSSYLSRSLSLFLSFAYLFSFSIC